jgi:prepilin-type processing-associated H-X9-DG protein
MKILLAALCLGLSLAGSCQHPLTTELLYQETKFSLQSQLYGLRFGFLDNLDSSAKGLNKNGFTNLFTIWQQRNEVTGGPVLVWEPSYAYASSDGFSGVTYGPYFTRLPGDSVLSHTGFFFTIWKRSKKDSPYKIIFDTGIKFPGETLPGASLKPSPTSFVLQQGKPASGGKIVKQRLENYQRDVAKTTLGAALSTFLFADGHVLLSKEGVLSRKALAASEGARQSYQLTTESIQPLSGSLWVEYGRLFQPTSQKTGYYIHVWNVAAGGAKIISALYKWD